MDDSNEFLAVIEGAVEADPSNASLRLDFAELLLTVDPRRAANEVDAALNLGVAPESVNLLRARIAAEILRRSRNASPPPAPATPLMPPTPPMPPTTPATAALPDSPSADRDTRPPIRATDQANERPVWDVERSTVTLANVAGLTDVKAHLDAAFFAPMRNPELASMFGQKAGGSLLMFGPPGCGKTFLARAVAGELGAGFIHATLAQLVGEYWGQTEKAIAALFAQARASAPCVIFFDEFDALGGKRHSGSSAAQTLRMMVTQLLEEFDGVGSANDGVYVLAATNRPWDIDPAFRRPGRLDRSIVVLPPDPPARWAIVHQQLAGKFVAPDTDVMAVVNQTEGYSGADVAYAVETAVQQAFLASLQAGTPQPLTTGSLLAAAASITPSTRQWFREIAPLLQFGVDDGTFGQLRDYIARHPS
ncbi:ATP-binding protein [Microbacterium gorillae]|uniref:ATP-binding protein n=1 Tax=Microbacterium gorillae TaxID=1231063 RepID=UPI003D9784B9